jgi:hypothetical protein
VCAPSTPQGAAAARGQATRRPGLAAIVRTHGEAFRRRHQLTAVQHRALRAIETCRTPALGGHLERCDRCGATRAVYHSCRNRHCPQCQSLAQTRWVEARRADLLPIPYFHVVFTLPHALNALAQSCPRLVYSLLFRCAAETLQSFARDPRHLGGEIGITAVLHTWGQNLNQHLHLHCVVTGGALAPDESRWIPARKRFLFPVRALSKVFRGKFLAALQAPVERRHLPDEGSLPDLLRALRGTPWVVYAKPPFGGPGQVLAYLGRYTHRAAIGNERIFALRGGHVCFRWRDYADHDRTKLMTLPAEEFLRRFLLHVLPAGFQRIRHFGLLANRRRAQTLPRCRELLQAAAPPPPPPGETALESLLRLTGLDLIACPVCHEGPLRVVAALAPGAPAPEIRDTS